MPNLFEERKLHAFGDADAEEAHCSLHCTSDGIGERETERAYRGVLFLENGAVVIELVVFLHEVVGIVGDESRRVITCGQLHSLGEVAECLDERYFFFVGLNAGVVGCREA